MNLNIKTPIAKTIKFAIKLKVLRRLFNLSLLFLEQLNDGTKLMWLICTAAQPMFIKPGKIV